MASHVCSLMIYAVYAMLNPLHLRTFLAAQRLHSFTEAAKELSLSQPAISRHIQHLEAELGVKLFNFVGKVPYTTDAGTVLVKQAKIVLDSLELAADLVRAREHNIMGTLRVGTSTTPGLYLLPTALARFAAKYPKVNIELSIRDSAQVQHLLSRNEIDVGFIGGPVKNEQLTATSIVEDELVCFTSASHQLAQKLEITPADLSEEIAVIRRKGSASRDSFRNWLSEHGSRAPRVIEVHCPEEQRILVQAGLGFGFISLRAIQKDIDSGVLKRLDVDGLLVARTLRVVHVTTRPVSPASEALIALIHAIAANAP